MPIPVTYPGVYVQELPSGEHVVSGVPTSITAFIGRAPIGSTDDPITVFDFGDYERFFGGLSYNYPMSYAVKDFFLNGGSQAIIIRLFKAQTTGDITDPKDWDDKAKVVADALLGLVDPTAKLAAVISNVQNAIKTNNYTTEPEVTTAKTIIDALE